MKTLLILLLMSSVAWGDESYYPDKCNNKNLSSEETRNCILINLAIIKAKNESVNIERPINFPKYKCHSEGYNPPCTDPNGCIGIGGYTGNLICEPIEDK